MVAMRDIRAFARRIAEEFKPRRIILFGSYAYGRPTIDSDVDLLVIFPGRRSAVNRSLDIRMSLDSGFPMDLLTRTEEEVRRRIAMNDWFMREIIQKGKTLYDVRHARVGPKSGRGLQRRHARSAST